MGKASISILRKIKNILETNTFLAGVFDKVAESFLYKKFIYGKIEKYAKSIKETKRYNVIIETTNICNAKCAMCPHTKMKRKTEVMSEEIFNLILEKLQKESISPLAFILNGFGEPLTDKKIFERVKKIKSVFPPSIVKFYSNLGLANGDLIEELIKSGLDEINVSFNGFSRENYEETMKINYKKTLENLNSLIQKRNELNSQMKIRLSMTLVRENDEDKKKFIREWRNKADSVSVNKVHTYNNSIADVSGKNKINFNKFTYPCKYIWNTIVFGVTGDIYLCCLDYEGDYNFGNIRDKRVLETFYSENFEKIREKHLKNNIRDARICSACYTPYKNGVEWLVDNLY